MSYRINKKVMTDEKDRAGFDRLIQNTFGLSFEEWYRKGQWGEWNQPYSMYDGEKCISNVTVNHMTALFEGKVRKYIQLGGVATDPEYRRKGLSRILMDEAIKDWKESSDCIFLLGNDTVAEFYPKFDFVEMPQYIFEWERKQSEPHGCDDIFEDICAEKSEDMSGETSRRERRDKREDACGKPSGIRKLDYELEEDRAILKKCFEKGNPYAKLQFIDCYSLLQFYCIYGMDQNLYYDVENDALLIGETEDQEAVVFGIFCDGTKSLQEMLERFSHVGYQKAVLQFAPTDLAGLTEREADREDNHLFVLKGTENLFANNHLCIPEINHT